MGVEPIRPNGHMALNHACLPIPAPGLNKIGKSYTIRRSDLAGARTQDPLLKREMLYQLSYQVVIKIKSHRLLMDCRARRVQIYYHYYYFSKRFSIKFVNNFKGREYQ